MLAKLFTWRDPCSGLTRNLDESRTAHRCSLSCEVCCLPLQVFNSHCAPEPVVNMQPEQLTIAELKGRLKELNLPLNGRKVGIPSTRTSFTSSVLVPYATALPAYG